MLTQPSSGGSGPLLLPHGAQRDSVTFKTYATKELTKDRHLERGVSTSLFETEAAVQIILKY